MKIMNADGLMSGLYIYRIDRQFFNELINYMGGCSEYFSTTSDGTDSDEEKAMFHQHAIDIRALQSDILSRAVTQDHMVIVQLSEGQQSALFYNLVSMLEPVPEGNEAGLPEEPALLTEPGGYFRYPILNSQFVQVLLALSGLLRDLNMILGTLDPAEPNSKKLYLNIEKRRNALIELQGNLIEESYQFQDSETGRTMAAMIVRQSQIVDLFRALLSVTTIEYGKTDFASTLPQL